MVTILPQCAKDNLNLLHILKLTDFLQNVLLKKTYLFAGLPLLYQLDISPIKVGGYHCTSDIYVKTCSFNKSTN
jgi:hypothetical protein